MLAGLGLVGAGTLSLSGCFSQPPSATAPSTTSPGSSGSAAWTEKLKKLEQDAGITLAVCASVQGGQRLEYRATEPLALCSTFKAILVGAVLSKHARDDSYWATQVMIDPAKVLSYAPITQPFAGRTMPISALCDAALRYSDNTAANLLLEQLGGPPALTSFVAELGFKNTRLDRIEPDLNESKAGDARDTSTAADLAGIYSALLLGDALGALGQSMLRGWMLRNTTSSQKMGAGIAQDAELADKTGSGSYGTLNDVGVIFRKAKPPVTLAILSRAVTTDPDAQGDAEVIVKATQATLDAIG